MARTVLVSMPWQAVDAPSLPLGLLRALCRRDGLSVPSTYHGGLRWCEYLLREAAGEIDVADYSWVANNGMSSGVGDWIFAGALYDDPEFGVLAFEEYCHVNERAAVLSLATAMRAHAGAFVKETAEEILATDPELVGFSTTFMQNVPSLALARQLKLAKPELLVVFGGGNCDGDMGAALHRNFPFVDFVVRGEGERAFPQLLRALDGQGELSEIPGLCWRDGSGSHVNRATAPPIPATELPSPDYDDWFDTFESSPIAAFVEPKLMIETARGCWWGEKHHCTFCGLNGSLMEFRSKPPARAVQEVAELVSRHKVLDIMVVDNIIDNSYFNTVLPAIGKLGWDLRIHYEVKANLTPEQIECCRANHVMHVQPGIESLVSPVLKIMDKGVSAVRNVRTLRDCESSGVTAEWNWLYGFPAERSSDYSPVIQQIPALRHLQPPSGPTRIVLERFSPNFNNPALGFAERRPAWQYRYLYQLPEEELHDLVYLFDTPAQGLSEAEADPLRSAVDQWNAAYQDSSLEAIPDAEGGWVIVDRRVGWTPAEHHVPAGVFADAYRELEKGRSVVALLRRLRESGHEITHADLQDWVDRMVTLGLLFVESGSFVTLATRRVPVKMAPAEA